MEISGNSIGIIAGLLSFVAYLLYILSMLQRRCRPNRMTWWTLTFIGIGIATSYYISGARQTAWITLAYVLGPLLISLLSFHYGQGGWKLLDRYCLLGVGVSLVLWWIFESALVGLLVNILIDFFALGPTIKKSILDPMSEDKVAWAIELVSNILNTFALERWSFSLVVYPVYLISINLFITILLFWPRKQSVAENFT